VGGKPTDSSASQPPDTAPPASIPAPSDETDPRVCLGPLERVHAALVGVDPVPGDYAAAGDREVTATGTDGADPPGSER
jgi:hypothetical protein